MLSAICKTFAKPPPQNAKSAPTSRYSIPFSVCPSSLALSTTGSGVGVAAPLLVGGVALLMPNTTSADSAFYKSEQYAQLTKGNTQVRINLKYLDDGAVSVYGFYTGNQPDWRQVPVVAATPPAVSNWL